eukprot:TRINITY_DN3618_c0_g2_i1.p1 TRINITY_DN3618_c0_g2~~TRINITY_DN3618_c0_g2_i1.p1  ORF type:complete len:1285 (+),score=365.89 TRINITY_DN3618_c0_g2_i1:47-3856(+)
MDEPPPLQLSPTHEEPSGSGPTSTARELSGSGAPSATREPGAGEEPSGSGAPSAAREEPADGSPGDVLSRSAEQSGELSRFGTGLTPRRISRTPRASRSTHRGSAAGGRDDVMTITDSLPRQWTENYSDCGEGVEQPVRVGPRGSLVPPPPRHINAYWMRRLQTAVKAAVAASLAVVVHRCKWRAYMVQPGWSDSQSALAEQQDALPKDELAVSTRLSSGRSRMEPLHAPEVPVGGTIVLPRPSVTVPSRHFLCRAASTAAPPAPARPQTGGMKVSLPLAPTAPPQSPAARRPVTAGRDWRAAVLRRPSGRATARRLGSVSQSLQQQPEAPSQRPHDYTGLRPLLHSAGGGIGVGLWRRRAGDGDPAPPKTGQYISVADHVAVRREWTHKVTELLQRKLREYAESLERELWCDAAARYPELLDAMPALRSARFRRQASPANTLRMELAAARKELRQAEERALALLPADGPLDSPTTPCGSDDSEGSLRRRCEDSHERCHVLRSQIQEEREQLELLVAELDTTEKSRKGLERQARHVEKSSINQSMRRPNAVSEGASSTVADGPPSTRAARLLQTTFNRERALKLRSGGSQQRSQRADEASEGLARAWTMADAVVLAGLQDTEQEEQPEEPMPIDTLPPLAYADVALASEPPESSRSSDTDSELGEEIDSPGQEAAAELRKPKDAAPMHTKRQQRVTSAVERVQDLHQTLTSIEDDVQAALQERSDGRAARLMQALLHDDTTRRRTGGDASLEGRTQLEFAELAASGVSQAALQRQLASSPLGPWPGQSGWENATAVSPSPGEASRRGNPFQKAVQRMNQLKSAEEIRAGDTVLVRDHFDDPWQEAHVISVEGSAVTVTPAAPPDTRRWPTGERMRRFKYCRRVPPVVYGPGPWTSHGPFTDELEDAADKKALAAVTSAKREIGQVQSQLDQLRRKQAERRRERERLLVEVEQEMKANIAEYDRRLNEAVTRRNRLQQQQRQLLAERLKCDTDMVATRGELQKIEDENAAMRAMQKKPPRKDRRVASRLSHYDALGSPMAETPPMNFAEFSAVKSAEPSPRTEVRPDLGRLEVRAEGSPKELVAAVASLTGVQMSDRYMERGVQNNIELELGLSCPGNDRVSLARRERLIRGEFQNLRGAISRLIEFNCELEAEITCNHCVELCGDPRILWPCGHTFCHTCLESMKVGEEGWRCARCGMLTGDGHVANCFTRQLIAKWDFKECGYHDLSLAVAAFEQEIDDIDAEVGGGWRSHVSAVTPTRHGSVRQHKA